MKKLLVLLIFTTLFIQCKKEESKPIEQGLVTNKAMVVSAREEASKIGTAILKQGGNAFDAMVATELALAVSYPVAGNLGGGGFMVYRKNDGTIGGLDYREKAPLSSHKNMYLDDEGNIIENKSLLGATAVGVPGTIAGVFAVHKKFGSLPIEVILQPVIDLAKRGVIVTKKQAARIKHYQPNFLKANKEPIPFDKEWKENDSIKYPALAATLTRIQKNGRDEFYKGETAKKLAAFMQKNGGYITEEDLAKYEAKWRTPVTFMYDGLKIISMSPPSSGGICLAQILKAVEPFDLDTYGHNSAKAIQVITEAERRAYADRSNFDKQRIYIKKNE